MKGVYCKKQIAIFAGFLLAELILYGFILTAGGTLLVACSFGAIVLCFLYVLAQGRRSSLFVTGGLACTVLADFCLVVCTPRQQLWGMVFFLIAQSLYAIRLHTHRRNKPILILRVGLTLLIEAVAVLVLGDRLDALVVVSVCYYANLAVNILQGFTQFQSNRLFPIGLVLFILCDTVIGLQVASGGYLPISQDSWLYRILFMDFNLSWFFYLPSQVLIALSAGAERDRN